MVPPRGMCRKHLLGEHVECHMFVGHLNAGRRLGRYAYGLCGRHLIRKRHDELAAEMVRRGMRHESPLAAFNETRMGFVHPDAALRDLIGRCPDCRREFRKLGITPEQLIGG